MMFYKKWKYNNSFLEEVNVKWKEVEMKLINAS